MAPSPVLCGQTRTLLLQDASSPTGIGVSPVDVDNRTFPRGCARGTSPSRQHSCHLVGLLSLECWLRSPRSPVPYEPGTFLPPPTVRPAAEPPQADSDTSHFSCGRVQGRKVLSDNQRWWRHGQVTGTAPRGTPGSDVRTLALQSPGPSGDSQERGAGIWARGSRV